MRKYSRVSDKGKLAEIKLLKNENKLYWRILRQ